MKKHKIKNKKKVEDHSTFLITVLVLSSLILLTLWWRKVEAAKYAAQMKILVRIDEKVTEKTTPTIRVVKKTK